MAGHMPEFGVVGLGKMSGGLALQALEKALHVVGHDTDPAPAELKSAGVDEATDMAALCARLKAPRIVFLYVPVDPPVDMVITEFADCLAPGDVAVDGSSRGSGPPKADGPSCNAKTEAAYGAGRPER